MLPALTLLAQIEDATLLGVVWSRKPELSSAVVRVSGRTRVVGIGDQLWGAKVVEILPAGIALAGEAGRWELRLRGEAAASPVANPLAPPSGARSGEDAAAPPALETPDVKTLRRSDVDARLRSEIPRILAETALFPVTEDGRVVGFTLTRIPEGTLLSEVGLLPGDVLTHVNDVAVDGLPTLISLWPRLQDAPQLRAEVLRAGRPVSLTLNIK